MVDIRLSVVIPTHNRKKMLIELLESLSQQTLDSNEFEVLVVIDGSSDGTLESARGLNPPFSLTVLSQQQSGVSVARNRGAQAAKGELLLFLDDDVLADRRLLESHVATQQENPPGVVLGRLAPDQEDMKCGWKLWEDQVLANHYQAMEKGTRPPAGRRLYSGNFSVPRKVFGEASGFNEDMARGEDVELGFRLEQRGVPFYFNANASVVHRGYRSFDSWVRSAHTYGRTEVMLAHKKWSDSIAHEGLISRYSRQNIVVRGMVRGSLKNKRLHALFIRTSRTSGALLTQMGLRRLAHLSYGAVSHLQYWLGVAEELGGSAKFVELVDRYRGKSTTSREVGVR